MMDCVVNSRRCWWVKQFEANSMKIEGSHYYHIFWIKTWKLYLTITQRDKWLKALRNQHLSILSVYLFFYEEGHELFVIAGSWFLQALLWLREMWHLIEEQRGLHSLDFLNSICGPTCACAFFLPRMYQIGPLVKLHNWDIWWSWMRQTNTNYFYLEINGERVADLELTTNVNPGLK